tara:strand:+ start:10247 stop:11164 length:918 start_codon:yes stop_codon:yes gene_type:complete
MLKVFYCVAFLIFISCGEDESKSTFNQQEFIFDEEDIFEEDITYTVKQIKELKSAAKVVYTLPSPLEMAELLQSANAVYDVSILNDPDAINDYVTDVKQSLNLGVYFADLSFTSMFDYPMDAMKFMGAAQVLSSELNIEGVFTEEVRMKIEGNMDNNDSLIDIIASTYMETDLYLQDNDRSSVSKYILLGAWIEGLYIAVNLKLDEGKEQPIWNKIAEQKPALSNLIKMLQSVEDSEFDEKIKTLTELELLFAEVKLEDDGETTFKTNNPTKTTLLGSELNIFITKEIFDKIKLKTKTIRNSITD